MMLMLNTKDCGIAVCYPLHYFDGPLPVQHSHMSARNERYNLLAESRFVTVKIYIHGI